MDSLFGGVERTDAEAAILGVNDLDKTKDAGTSQHVEHASPATLGEHDPAAVARTQTLGTIDERK